MNTNINNQGNGGFPRMTSEDTNLQGSPATTANSSLSSPKTDPQRIPSTTEDKAVKVAESIISSAAQQAELAKLAALNELGDITRETIIHVAKQILGKGSRIFKINNLSQNEWTTDTSSRPISLSKKDGSVTYTIDLRSDEIRRKSKDQKDYKNQGELLNKFAELADVLVAIRSVQAFFQPEKRKPLN